MNKQDILNIVVPAMREQRRPAMGASTCLYRGPGGTKCAVGHILTDEEAALLQPSDDYSEAIKHAEDEFWEARPDLREHQSFLAELQRAHDERAEDISLGGIDEEEWFEGWETRAQKVATDYGLEWPHA